MVDIQELLNHGSVDTTILYLRNAPRDDRLTSEASKRLLRGVAEND